MLYDLYRARTHEWWLQHHDHRFIVDFFMWKVKELQFFLCVWWRKIHTGRTFFIIKSDWTQFDQDKQPVVLIEDRHKKRRSMSWLATINNQVRGHLNRGCNHQIRADVGLTSCTLLYFEASESAYILLQSRGKTLPSQRKPKCMKCWSEKW